MPRRRHDPDLLQAFGARMKAARIAGDFTQERLAQLLKVRPSTISQFETGDVSPTLTTVAAVAQALHVRLRDLVDVDGAPVAAEPGTTEEAEALARFRALPKDQRSLVSGLLRALAKSSAPAPTSAPELVLATDASVDLDPAATAPRGTARAGD